MVSRALEADIQSGYAEIQEQVDASSAKNATLLEERMALTDRVTVLEAKVAEMEEQRRTSASEVEVLEAKVAAMEEQRRTSDSEMEVLRSHNSVLEAEVAAERSLSALVSQGTWKAMESMEGAIAELGGVAPPRNHTVKQLDATLERLHRSAEVFLPAARAYGNHCAKAAWTAALVSLHRAGCPHVDGLGAGSIPVASASEVAAGHSLVRRAGNALAREFWLSSGRVVTMESLRLALAQKKKGKGPADGGGAAEPRDNADAQV